MKYKVLMAPTALGLAVDVEKHAGNGWKLQGGVAVVYGRLEGYEPHNIVCMGTGDLMRATFMQAMTNESPAHLL